MYQQFNLSFTQFCSFASEELFDIYYYIGMQS